MKTTGFRLAAFAAVAIFCVGLGSVAGRSQQVVIYSDPAGIEPDTPLDGGCPDGIEDRKSDLCAQWKAADAAQNSVVWSEKSFYLGVFGAAVGAATLAAAIAAALYARIAAHQAERSADVAAASVATARDLGEAQIRAYLYFKNASYELSKDTISIILEIGNSGQSPANQVRLTSDLTVQEVGGMPSHPRVLTYLASDKRQDEAQPVNSNSTVLETVYFFWGLGIPSQDEVRSSDHLKSVFRGGNSLLFDVEIQWVDVFGATHKFQAYMDAEVGPSPTNNRKRRANKGSLDIRTRDTMHRIMADQ
ncbi:hypothetical protein LZK73_11885 [Neorhizobium galegae]|nr:hypothetical protein LZK73_11885 [Neorhizobium galegae]